MGEKFFDALSVAENLVKLAGERFSRRRNLDFVGGSETGIGYFGESLEKKWKDLEEEKEREFETAFREGKKRKLDLEEQELTLKKEEFLNDVRTREDELNEKLITLHEHSEWLEMAQNEVQSIRRWTWEKWTENQAQEQNLKSAQESLAEKEKKADDILGKLDGRMSEVEKREEEFDLFVEGKHRELELKEKELKEKEKILAMKEDNVISKENELQEKINELDLKESSLGSRQKELDVKLREVDSAQELNYKRLEEIHQSEKNLDSLKVFTKNCFNELHEKKKQLLSERDLVAKRAKDLEHKEKQLEDRVRELELEEKQMRDYVKGLECKQQLLTDARVSSIRRKLLVLDVNGLLADIMMCRADQCTGEARVCGRSVHRRPFCDDFLKFCFQNFDVGIWSSRSFNVLHPIVDFLLGDTKEKLLFCWDMSHCTETGVMTLANKHKPLVCKELEKIWINRDGVLPCKGGVYNESNTLLLDDSPCKALLNPLHTAIFPYSYSYMDKGKDKSLGPEGDLRAYLEGLLKCDNVQIYVEQHPFGQKPITEQHSSWTFYKKILSSFSPELEINRN